MNVMLLVADAASGHKDGTFSMLRAGISKLNVVPGNKAIFRGAMVIRLEEAIGKHEFAIRIRDEDGIDVAPEMSGEADFQDKGNANIVANLQLTFPKLGKYQFSVSVDGQEVNTYDFEVRGAPQAKEKVNG